MKHAKNFWDLIVYQKARELQKEIFELSKQFPPEEKYSLTDQIRRSSRSIGAQIAEAWGKRRYEKHFISKLTDADSEQYETQHWLLTATDSEYVTREEAEPLIKKCREVGRLLGGTISMASSFCDPSFQMTQNNQGKIKEDEPDYFVWPSEINSDPKDVSII